MISGNSLIIIGNPSPIHVGCHLYKAALSLKLQVHLGDVRQAFAAPWPLLKVNWWLRGRRPPRLGRFSQQIVDMCRSHRPRWLVATGLAPIDGAALQAIGRMGIRRLNFLTDDPWNRAHRAGWFWQALPHYDIVFSPRQANMADLQEMGCQAVVYLPFAYEPSLHFRQEPATAAEAAALASDVVFAGGADADRVPTISALLEAGFEVALYGGYWDRYPQTRGHSRGQAEPARLRLAVSGAKVALCLVRRANRDGHAMRSYEVPAMGGCPLVEDTPEHRQIFGPEGEAALYFENTGEMVEKVGWLLDHDAERRRLAQAGYDRIVGGNNRYADRLLTMLEQAEGQASLNERELVK